MKLKIFSILLILIISLNIQSAGKFRLATINNQTNKQFDLGYADTDEYTDCYCVRNKPIKPNAIDETYMDIIYNGSKDDFEFNLRTNSDEPDFGNLYIKIVNNYIVLSSECGSISNTFSSAFIDLNYDYLINLTIKPDNTIEMLVTKK